MTDPTIDGVSRELRELLEQVARPIMKSRDETVRRRAISKLRALLDADHIGDSNAMVAPAVEQQPDAWKCTGDIGTPCVTASEDCANAWYSHGGTVERPYADPPGVDSLQSTIAQLRQHKIDYMDAAEETRKALTIDIAQLQARIAELESGRGEPVLWFKRLTGLACKSNGQTYDVMFTECPGYQPLFSGVCQFTLPERMTRQQVINNTHWSEGWNDCLDATAALNGELK